MRIVPFIVMKYLWSGKNSKSINIIASITILGLSIGTAALIIVLSVFNGFEELLTSVFSKHNPDIKIVQKEGRLFHERKDLILKLQSLPEVKIVSRVFEQNCMLQYNSIQDFGTIKGIDSNFVSLISMDSAIVEGEMNNTRNQTRFAYLGVGISNKLGISIEKFYQDIQAFTPGFNEGKIELKEENFKKYSAQPIMIYSLHQDSDADVMMTDLDELRKYLGDTTILTSIQIKLNKANESKIAVEKISAIMGNNFKVKDRYLQDEAFLKIMNLEKWLFFTLFILTLVLVSFSVVGTLWMMVIEKRLDIAILKSLGMENFQIQRIYKGVGLGIGLIGIIVGFILSLIFYKMQVEYALIKVPEDFIVDSYPISIRFTDFIIVTIVVLAIVFLATLLPSNRIKEVELIYKED